MTTVRKSGDTLDEMEKPPANLEALRATNKTLFYRIREKGVYLSHIFVFTLYIKLYNINLF